MTDKRYIGSGKIKTFDNGGSIIKYSTPIDDLEKEIAKEKAAGKTWININICERKAPSDKGMTHYGVIDDWEPTQQQGQQSAPQAGNQAAANDFSDDIPF